MNPRALLLVGVVVASALLAWFSVGQGQEPIEWQPFYAEFTVTDRRGTVTARGRYWRSRDGSDRREFESRGDLAIQIRRITDETCYRYKLATGWTAQPMRLPPAGWRPERPSRPRAEAVLVLGVPGLKTSTGQGDWRVELPSLDFFRAQSFAMKTGRLEQFSRIQRGEPDPTLFLPPPGVRLARLDRVAGIIWAGSGAAGAATQ